MVKKKERENGSIKSLLPFSLRKKNPKYHRLPAHLLKLSVVKLDGTSFSKFFNPIHCFQVPRNASVAKLRLAIEEEFSLSHSYTGKLQWPVVWSHFCLRYGAEKLISDKASIESFGIKDGDQLHFMQHMRIDEAAVWQSAENCNAGSNQRPTYNDYQELASPVQKATLTCSLRKLISPSRFRRSLSI